MYSEPIRRALETAFVSDLDLDPVGGEKGKFKVAQCVSGINAKIAEWVAQAGEEHDWALRQRTAALRGLQPPTSKGAHIRRCFREARSNVCCLGCLFERPQHELLCGHAVCDTCAQRHGRPRLEREYSYLLTRCPFCRAPVGTQVIQLKPPTAGVRVLSLDGGGVRGVIPLRYLSLLQTALGPRARIQDYFDIAVGTSAGSSFPRRSMRPR